MSKTPIILAGKAVKSIAKLRGGGSALPGLFIEKIDPGFMKRSLSQLPRGVVVISGTNGKTTTTKMVVELLQGQGLKVFTNRTGSNFIRGVVSALLEEVDRKGILTADIAVLELDEAHAVHFVKIVQPRYSLMLNVMRDQLDRFGEIDATAKMLQTIAEATTDTIVVNREDPRLYEFPRILANKDVVFFGLDSSLSHLFPSDDDMRSTQANTVKNKKPPAVCTLEQLHDRQAVFTLKAKKIQATLQLVGVYNIYNAAAALALINEILGSSINQGNLLKTLEDVRPAFGRGEKLLVRGQPLELVLVKNPSGFRLGLSSFPPEGYATMIAINDNYADGRDMSWLWDVDFESLQLQGIEYVSGIRAYDMALRLQYEEVEIAHVDTNIPKSLKQFIRNNPTKPKRIYCTYTAMLALRRELGKITEVEAI
jgi:UDP-N-acetylmuramyl tripeptide synthase